MLFLQLLLFLLPLLALAAPDFYKVLGVDKKATDRELKKAYKQLSKKYHPDKNPENEEAHQKFIDVAEAYEALSNEESRRVYDKYGYDGYKQHQQGGGQGGGHHDPFDLFSRFFGGGGHAGHGHGQRRGHNMEVKVSVPLKDFYNGNRVEFAVEKQQICEECEGSGSSDGHTEKCDQCNGRGVRIIKQMLAPGIFQQMQAVCDKCQGKGSKITSPCPVCRGARVVKKPVTHWLEVDKGVPNGMRVSFENEADESPDWVAGDLIVQLDERSPVDSPNTENLDGWWFRRRGKDLVHKEVLSLREALLGDWSRNLTHLDGHEVKLGRKKGQVIQPGHVDVIKGEGMPVWQEDGHGDLLVEYTVILPDQMQSGMRKDIEAIFEKWRQKVGVNPKDEL
ncbi:hypothetical protein AOL_s00083g354 [Orbilia oligospora ATCC 24927]|uniref:DnaJ-related protein scj1 n=1 Tax=Arthrobotrys oligospora (strain ATCC 24927 / CBS 115.81 / DSM 1491) TaxID=756982 RepID=G1XH73_ARTOA|nr:hypothetical protein AOL_s00083g354 [Orbilia oligospora ATCC 24927]EGX47545.1 hypothetical protein AOL_s00083g354 [Orbilia oligospora ATCC 24927]